MEFSEKKPSVGMPPMDGAPHEGFGPPPDWRPPMADISWVKRKYLDIPYGNESKGQCFDLFLPEEGDGPFPLFVHIHGGGFAFGNKRDDHMDAYLGGIRRGYAVASLEYRLSGEAKFPAAVLDCREAIRYIKVHAAELRVNPDRIAVLGGSAGGNLAAMVGMNVPNGAFPGEEGKEFSCEPCVQVAIDQFGPVRFETMEAQAHANGVSETHPNAELMPESKYLGVAVDKAPLELLTAAYPANYASEAMAPMLVQHGTADHLVPWAQSEEFVKDLTARGFGHKVEYIPLVGADHEDKMFTTPENMDLVFNFIERHM